MAREAPVISSLPDVNKCAILRFRSNMQENELDGIQRDIGPLRDCDVGDKHSWAAAGEAPKPAVSCLH
jgi:hypothetical protein